MGAGLHTRRFTWQGETWYKARKSEGVSPRP